MSAHGLLTETPTKTLLTTTNPFEQKFGYHRAVRRGPYIAVSGTTALKLTPPQISSSEELTSREDATASSSKVHFPGDAYAQSVHVLETCLEAVKRLGGKKEDIVRVRMFVADGKDCGIVGEAFSKVFRSQNQDAGETSGSEGRQDVVGTAATMIVVPGGFVDGDILVEIEVDAFVV